MKPYAIAYDLGSRRHFQLRMPACLADTASKQTVGVAKQARPSRFKRLSDWLKEPDIPMRWLIDGWMNDGSRVLTFAQFKAGKTTLISNLIRSVADGDAFLGEADAIPLSAGQTIVVLDFEMSENQLKEWTVRQGIRNTDRVVIEALRGVARSFNILDSTCRSEWADDLRTINCRFLVVDCIGPIMSALELDESNNAQVAKFLRLVDELLVEARVPNCWLVHHMGHDEKRPRGASAVLGWCDVSITLTRRGDPSTGQRSISAAGRDVSQPKRELVFDPNTHRFTLAPATKLSFTLGSLPGAGRPKAGEKALSEVLALLRPPAPPLGVRELTQRLTAKGFSFHENTVRLAVALGVQRGELKEGGAANRRTYELA